MIIPRFIKNIITTGLAFIGLIALALWYFDSEDKQTITAAPQTPTESIYEAQDSIPAVSQQPTAAQKVKSKVKRTVKDYVHRQIDKVMD